MVNRVKPHTTFHGPVESGLFKMMAVGLGKASGASSMHGLGPLGMVAEIPEAGRQLAGREGIEVVSGPEPLVFSGGRMVLEL